MRHSFILRPGIRVMRSLDFSATLVSLTSVAVLAELVLAGMQALAIQPLGWLSGAAVN
ncbi:MAG: hypothetical protein JSR14_02130 [Proteobacteria bacterium]|nr:hypothetical protein [Pseudomonadota bacterium]